MDKSQAGPPVIGRYRVLGQAGKGGMSAVYLAEHLDTGVRAALKVFSPRDIAVPDFRRRVKREVETLRQCSHPNIVRVLDHSLEGDQAYLALEYHEGEHLGTLVRSKGAFPPAQVARIGADVADALDHCHRQGIYHRDIKPANILLETATGRAILLDFGIVKAVNMTTITRFGGIMGSLGYLAPEQILGKPVDGRTDLYQLGMVLVKLATGRDPLNMEAEEKLIDARTIEEIRRWRAQPTILDQRPDFPAGLAEAILACVRLDPVERYATAGDLARALRPFES